MRLLTAQQVREIDRQAIEEWGVPGVVLMENAGVGATRLLTQQLEHRTPGRIAIFVGPGNNGGDGCVVARHLLNQGFSVLTFLCTDPSRLQGDAAINYQILEKMTNDIVYCGSPEELEPWFDTLRHFSAIVDSILGTGLKRPISGWYLELIDQLNAIEGPFKLALDLPSGMESFSGRPHPRCFRADMTATFAFAKVGLAMPDALPFIGKLEVLDIGIPAPIMEQMDFVCELQNENELRAQWPQHPYNSHKGTFGHVLVIGGSRGLTGAAKMACRSSLRSGVGLCTLAVEEAIFESVAQSTLETMCASLGDFEQFEDALSTLQQRKSAIVLGPGLGQSLEKQELLAWLIQNTELPMIIDADGLNLLASQRDILKQAHSPIVLTPHPGEMARLLGTTTRAVQGDRLNSARSFAQEMQVHLVLKGARTIIASPDGRLWINPTGNPGLATAGSGDVLSGMIGAFLARNLPPSLAARAAVYLHGKAADELQKTHGKSGIIASDIIQMIPSLLAQWECK